MSDNEDDDANPNGAGLPSSAEISKEVYGLATVIKLLREKTLTKGIIEYLVQVTSRQNADWLWNRFCSD